jgi:hypothetical protein
MAGDDSGSDSEFDSLPEQFSGKPAKLGPFLRELERTFKHQPETFSSDSSKVIMGTSHLRGAALKWALDHPESQASWDKFSSDLKERFGNPDKKATAFTQVKKLRQHGSARAYAARFRAYADEIEWGADASRKNKWFYRGLKDDIKDSLMSTDWDWKMDFEAFVDKCIKIDCKLHPGTLKEQVDNYDEQK